MDSIHKLYRGYKYQKIQTALLSSLNFGSKPSQHFLVSYPKSGNTWMRILLANLLSENNEEIDLRNVGKYVPDIYIDSQVRFIRDRNSFFNRLPIQFVKTHHPYLKFYKDKKIIYVVRD
ncbi:MAG: sulfotransferase domain-containing protein, partial [Chloroflexota bacterium]